MKKILTFALAVSMMASLAASASALEYSIAPPKDFDFGRDTSIEVIHTTDVGAPVMGGEADVAVPDGGVLEVPDALGKRLAVRPLIDSHAQIQSGDLQPAEGAVFVVEVARHLREQHGGLITAAAIHRAAGCDNAGGTAANDRTGRGNTTGGKVGRQVFAGMEGVHALRAENRRNERGIFAHIGVFHGTASYFGQIHTLGIGDKITLTTKLGTRTYKVTDVFKVSETDRSGLADSGENMLTLYTCVRNQRDQRWCVTAAEV